MQDLSAKDKELLIKLNIEDLTTTQVRLLKNVTNLLTQVLTADEESEYFEMSAELMKKVAETIKHAEFAIKNKEMAYGDQAVEYSVDYINESMEQNKLHNMDN